jgi:hypothetical protein
MVGLGGYKAALAYSTGYSQPFVRNTVRAELTAKVAQLPLMVWFGHGHNSDLARYQRPVTSWGVALEIGSF